MAVVGGDWTETAHNINDVIKDNITHGSSNQGLGVMTALSIGLEFEYDVSDHGDGSIAPEMRVAQAVHDLVAVQVGNLFESPAADYSP